MKSRLGVMAVLALGCVLGWLGAVSAQGQAGYVIAQVTIEDRQEYRKYEGGFMPILQSHKGEIVLVSDAFAVLEGEWPHTRTVVLRFPSAELAAEWHRSDAYQKLAAVRRRASRANMILASGR